MIPAAPKLHALILAAGASRRLGSPKQLVKYRGQSLLARTCALALSVTDSVAVSIASASRQDFHNILNQFPVTPLENSVSHEGMASSIRLGIEALPPGTRGLLILLCDQYRLEKKDLCKLIEPWQEAPDKIVAAKYGDTTGVPVIWPAQIFPELATLQGDRGARNLLQKYRQQVTAINLPEANIDLDTPDQKQQLEDHSSGQGICND